MIEDPDRWAIGYAEAGAHNVSVHAEAARDSIGIACAVRAAGARAGPALMPQTPLEPHIPALAHYDTLLVMSAEPGLGRKFIPEVLEKVYTARSLVDAGQVRLLIEIGGGISAETIAAAAEAGADCFVVGNAVYGTGDPARAVQTLRSLALAAARGPPVNDISAQPTRAMRSASKGRTPHP